MTDVERFELMRVKAARRRAEAPDYPDDPCENAVRCGNTATTVREVQGQPVRMCESCAAEHDEQ